LFDIIINELFKKSILDVYKVDPPFLAELSYNHKIDFIN